MGSCCEWDRMAKKAYRLTHGPAWADFKPWRVVKRGFTRPGQKKTLRAERFQSVEQGAQSATPSSSTSNLSVAPGGMTPPAPRAP